MKTPKVITNVERQAERQLNSLVRTVRQQYKRFVSGGTTSTAAAQRKFIRSVEKNHRQCRGHHRRTEAAHCRGEARPGRIGAPEETSQT